MKDKIVYALLAVSIIFNIVNFTHSCKTCSPAESATPTAASAATEQKPAGENMNEGIEVADVMTKLQRHMNKLHFAGENQNWPLANFYIHELDESMDLIANNNIVDEGINLSQLIKVMGKPALKELESASNAQDAKAFKEKYVNLMNNCNACHASSKHEFIVIKEPTVPAYDNQVYKK